MDHMIRCRDCLHFRTDVWSQVSGIPLIVGHEICRKWGGGCKTSPDGYCFMGERKEQPENEKENSLPPVRL